MRRRRLAILAGAIAVLGAGLVIAPQFGASAAPTRTTAELIVQKGGVRTGDQTVDGLAGAVFDFFAGTSGAPPGPGATPTDSCTTGADGSCAVNVAGRIGFNQGYWIRERTAPAGYSLVQTLDTGNTSVSAPNTYNRLFTGAVYNGSTYTFPMASASSSQNARGSYWADERDNPALPGACGLNIALLIDTSGSIGADAPAVKAAANGFVDALTGTPSQIALFSFATNATLRQASVPVSTTTGANAVKAEINTLPAPSGATNWDQALNLVASQSTSYDAVIMLTDGNPTVYGPSPVLGFGNHTRFREVENGIFSANAVKAQGTKVVVVGVGAGLSGSTDNLKAISGPTPGSDYYQTDFANLGTTFRSLALQSCLGTVSVVKYLIPPNGAPAQGVPAGGWTFSATQAGVTPVSGITDEATGGVSFSVPLGGNPTAPVTLTETQQGGYTLQQIAGFNATCTDSSGAAVASTNAGALGFTVDAQADDAVTCAVYNNAPQPPASVVVNKTWVINGVSYPETGQPDNFQAALSLTPGPSSPEFGVPYSDYMAGDSVDIGETIDVDRLPPGCGRVAVTGDLGSQTLVAGRNTFAVTNTVTCVTSLTLLKSVMNPYGTPADPTLWDLTANNGTQSFTGETGVREFITDNSPYTMSESNVPGYVQQVAPGSTPIGGATGSWYCVLRERGGDTGPVFRGLNGEVIVAVGQNAECTAVNVAQPAHLTLLKHVDNTGGGTATSRDWTLTAIPTDTAGGATTVSGRQGDASVTGTTVFPGTHYTLGEGDGPDGYIPSAAPTCVLTGTATPVPVTRGTIDPAPGEDVTCTFTNQYDPGSPTSPPPTSAPPTSVPPTNPPSSSSGPLPVTGSSFGTFAAGGLGLVLLGTGILVLTLRRRRSLAES